MAEDIKWKQAFEKELSMAEQAREAGNEGMARVCSRRAAGIVIKEFTKRLQLPNPGSNALECLKHLQNIQDVPPRAHEIAGFLLTRVNSDHELPFETDLIQETRNLSELLLQ